MITARTEDYLKEIFLMESAGRDITVTELAKRLGVTKATVTATARRMVEDGVLNHERYSELYLTEKGRIKALSVYRRHEGMLVFFHELLGAGRILSSKMACGMEHYIDSSTGERLYSLLEFFRRARAEKEPWIEDFYKSIDNQVLLPQPLSVFSVGQNGVVTRLSSDGKLRKRLQDTGFTAGAKVACLDSSSPGLLKVALEGKELSMPRNEASAVWLRIT
jgi:DtxR family Mn-dependent transcriptional regulator